MESVIKLLLEKGADLEATTKNEKTAFLIGKLFGKSINNRFASIQY